MTGSTCSFIWRQNPNRGIDETTTKTILQDVKVFAVDTSFVGKENEKGEQASQAKTISLLVTPQQAEKIDLVSQLGFIRLVMRSPDDSQDSGAGGADISDIFGHGEKSDRSQENRPGKPNAASSFLAMLNGGGHKEPTEAQPAAASVPDMENDGPQRVGVEPGGILGRGWRARGDGREWNRLDDSREQERPREKSNVLG